jgi:hypothetical protein
MKHKDSFYREIIAVIGIALLLGGITRSSRADSLYVGDVGDDTVKRYDAKTGQFLGVFVNKFASGTIPGEPIVGPRGLIFDHHGKLLLVNQNVNQAQNGTILSYRSTTGEFLGALVPFTDRNSPVAPRGLALRGALYVASEEGEDQIGKFGNGKLKVYSKQGDSLPSLNPSVAIISQGLFHPRGVVFGPDGHLYVSTWPQLGARPSGNILSFDTEKRVFLGVFASNANYFNFTGPEGLSFGSDGNLYVTSFRLDATDTDKILVFSGPRKAHPGTLLYKIDLDQVGGNRAVAEALLFGPSGFLYVPIFRTDGSPGEIRRYNVSTDTFPKTFDLFVSPGGPLIAPWYLSFGKTDPATLAYREDDDEHGD